jgi:hypothetical protein
MTAGTRIYTLTLPGKASAKAPRTPRRTPAVAGLLSNEQKAALCIRARAAFEFVHRREPHNCAELEEWRRAEQQSCTGKASLTSCTQADYLPLLAHFQNLAGESGHALNNVLRAGTEDVRQAMHALGAACGQRGLPMAYPAAICRRQYRCELGQATARQVWNLVYTVRNRRKANEPRRRGGAERKVGTSNIQHPTSNIDPEPDPFAPEIDEPF